MITQELVQDMSTLRRGLICLEYLRAHGPSRFKDLTDLLGLAPTVVSRILKDLQQDDWVHQQPESRRWELGVRMRELLPSRDQRLLSSSRELMAQLTHHTGQTSVLFTLEGRHVVCVHKEENEEGMKMQTVGGRRTRLAIYPWGWFFFEGLGPEEQKAILEQEKDATKARAEIEKGLEQGRKRGWVLRYGEERSKLAAPIYDSRGPLIAVLGMGFFGKAAKAQQNRWGAMLLETAGGIAHLMA